MLLGCQKWVKSEPEVNDTPAQMAFQTHFAQWRATLPPAYAVTLQQQCVFWDSLDLLEADGVCLEAIQSIMDETLQHSISPALFNHLSWTDHHKQFEAQCQTQAQSYDLQMAEARRYFQRCTIQKNIMLWGRTQTDGG